MFSYSSPAPRSPRRLIASVASIAIAASIGLGALSAAVSPVLADAVKIDAPQVAGFANVVEKVTPAVVSVRVKSRLEPAADQGFGEQGFDNLPNDHPLKRFFREFRGDDGGNLDGRRKQRRERRDGGELRPTSQGSGFFISADGYVVTNNHVIEGGAEFTVVTSTGDELAAKLVGTDPRTDLAVLKVDEKREFTYVAFADDSTVRVGDWVVAIGNPFGLGGTVTAGIVSARGRDIGAGPYDDFIQIDAAVNRGNSGGPAFNLSGEVVGINTAIFSPSGGNVGIAFAIPASTAREVVEKLRSEGSIARGWLGVQIQDVNSDIAESLGLADAKGALVSEPQKDSPGAAAGVKPGDVIRSVDGKQVVSSRDLARTIGALQPGKSVALGIWRNGKEETLSVTLGEIPGGEKVTSAETPSTPAEDQLAGLGLSVVPADGGNGLVVTSVDANSNAEAQGIAPGDVIVQINAMPVSKLADAEAAIADAQKAGRKAVLLQVQRDQASRFVALAVAKG